MNLVDIFQNKVLGTALAGWFLAGVLKIPIEYLVHHRWNWGLLFTTGGMPSYHSSLVTATTMGIGLFYGFNTPLFALAFAINMVVVYDAMGVRRQAGMQAKKINIIVEELLKGHPINEKVLLEAVGHTPLEALGGVVLGLVVGITFWLIWK